MCGGTLLAHLWGWDPLYVLNLTGSNLPNMKEGCEMMKSMLNKQCELERMKTGEKYVWLGIEVMRVPGGWIYTYINLPTSVFVPLPDGGD